jgi:hypothetical protein
LASPPPLPSVNTLENNLLTGEGEGDVGGAKSNHGGKAWCYINHTLKFWAYPHKMAAS